MEQRLGEKQVDYKCKDCDKENVKLWRQYNCFLDYIELRCMLCAAKDQNIILVNPGHDGMHDSKSGRTDQIGNLIPAIPSPNESFWGYTSVPQDRVEWWKGLGDI